jgi:hypothetical protein
MIIAVSGMKSFWRVALSVLGGNVIGYAAFRLALWWTPQWWEAAGPKTTVGMILLLMAFTAIAFAAPPVMVGALAARAAARYEPFVGLAAMLWGASARLWWPSQIPLLPPESWVLPMTLILLSGLMGGWLAGGFRRAS